MASPDFFWDFLPFWIMNYGLGLIGWTLVGRFLLGFLVPASSPNYIWRFFRRLTEWPLAVVRFVTPRLVPAHLTVALGAYWCFALRFVLFSVMAAHGMVPGLHGGG